MRNLILTPVYKAYDKVVEMCAAIDKYAVYDFLHVLVDDNSGVPPVTITPKRRVLTVRSDVDPEHYHKSQHGQCVQLGYDYAMQKFTSERDNLPFDYVFLIESDVIVKEAWDKKMIDLIPTLPADWASLDVQSVDAEGKTTYPTTVAPRKGYVNENLEHMEYADFQLTLFNPEVFKLGVKFSDIPSHFDILWSRKITELSGKQHYRTKLVEAMHYTYSSRGELPK